MSGGFELRFARENCIRAIKPVAQAFVVTIGTVSVQLMVASVGMSGIIHTPLVLTGETREMQETCTPAKQLSGLA